MIVTSRKAASPMSVIMGLVLLIVVAVIIFSIFFGLKGSGLFGKVGNTTKAALDFGVLGIGSGQVPTISMAVPESVEKDFEKVVQAFNSSKGTSECYIKFGALNGVREAQKFIFVFEKTSTGTIATIQTSVEGAYVNIKGQRAIISGVYPCVVDGNDGAIGQAFLEYYRDRKAVTSPVYADTNKLYIYNKEWKFWGESKRVLVTEPAPYYLVQLDNVNNMFFKPQGDKTCLIPTFNHELFGAYGGNEFRGDGGTGGLYYTQLALIAGNQKYKLKECSSMIGGVEYREGISNEYLIQDINTYFTDNAGKRWEFIIPKPRGITLIVNPGDTNTLLAIKGNETKIRQLFDNFIASYKGSKQDLMPMNSQPFLEKLKESKLLNPENITAWKYNNEDLYIFTRNNFYLCVNGGWGNVGFCTSDYRQCLNENWTITNSTATLKGCTDIRDKLVHSTEYYAACYTVKDGNPEARCLKAQECLNQNGTIKYSSPHTTLEGCETDREALVSRFTR